MLAIRTILGAMNDLQMKDNEFSNNNSVMKSLEVLKDSSYGMDYWSRSPNKLPFLVEMF